MDDTMEITKTNQTDIFYILNNYKQYGYSKNDVQDIIQETFNKVFETNKEETITMLKKRKNSQYIHYEDVILLRVAFACSEKYCDDGMQKGCYFIPSTYDDVIVFREFIIAFQEVSKKIQRGEGRTLALKNNKKSSCATYFYDIPLSEMKEETFYIPTINFEEKGITYDICYNIDNYKYDIIRNFRKFISIYKEEKRNNIQPGSEHSKFDLQYLFSFIDEMLE